MNKKYARFRGTEYCLQSFDTLREQLTNFPLLANPDLNKSMVLYADVSDQCIGAYLTQPCPERDSLVPGIPEEIPTYCHTSRSGQ